MAENTAYFDAIVAQRALTLDEEQYLEGGATISLETQSDLVEEDILTYTHDNFADFLRTLRYLPKEDQELLLSYYLLSKTQNTLALIHKSTQTICSFRIRMAVKKLGTFMLLGVPTPEVLGEILQKGDLEHSLKGAELSKVIDHYARTRSFQKVADHFHLHRPDIRRAMSRAAKRLIASKEGREHAVGAYIHGLIDKASATGQGFSKRKLAKQCHIYRVDPPILGEFRISVTDPDFDHVMVARANH